MGAPFLIEDVFHLLANLIDSRTTLSALSRVSKTFFEIFRPALYRHVWLEDYTSEEFACISLARKKSHISFTRTLYLGHRSRYVRGDLYRPDHEDEMEALHLLLQEMTNLRSFTIIGPLIRDFADEVSEEDGESQCSGEDGYESNSSAAIQKNRSLIQRLTKLKELRDITLASIENFDLNELTWRLPLFRNLRTLILYNLERGPGFGHVDDIGDVLLSSPGLESLGLSLRSYQGLPNDILQELVHYYQLKSLERNMPVLKLSELRLGRGFLPSARRLNVVQDDYLKDLTNLAFLKELYIENCNLDRMSYSYYSQYWEIVPMLFIGAINLKKLMVERLSPDIVELVNLLKLSKTQPCHLDEIEVSRYFEAIESDEVYGEDAYMLDPLDEAPLYSVPFEQVGTHWRKISYGTALGEDKKNMSKNLLNNFIGKCSDLEELSVPMRAEHFEIFKSSIMPRLKKLHTLMIPGGNVADLIPQTRPASEIHNMSKRVRLTNAERDQWTEWQHERQRIDFVTDLFSLNRRWVQQDSSITPLRYIGLRTHVYCCMFAMPGASYRRFEISITHSGTEVVQRYQVFKLARDEARAFAAVKNLDEEWC